MFDPMPNSALEPFTVYVHVPGISLADDIEIAYRSGCLSSLNYARWLEIDGEIASKRRHQFEAAKPCFYVYQGAGLRPPKTLADPAGGAAALIAAFKADTMAWRAITDPVLEVALDAANELHLALTLLTGVPLPALADSICYVASARGTSRIVGRLERHALLSPPRLIVTPDAVAQLPSTLALLHGAGAALATDEVRSAIDAMAATALPDFESIDGLMHCAITLEALLLADITSGVTAAFTERGAALLALLPAEVMPLRMQLDAVYAVRSDALHGRDLSQTPALANRSVDSLYHWVRLALGRALIRVIHVLRGAADPATRLATLRTELEAARTPMTMPVSLAGAPAGPLL